MNRSQIRARAYEVTGLQASDPLATLGSMNRHIDAALRHVTSDYDWPWLVSEASFALVAGTDEYPAPAAYLKTLDLTVTVGSTQGPLNYTSALTLDENYPDPTQRGDPRHFTVMGSVLRIRPVPQAAGTALHRFKRGEPALATDAATPLMPPDYHDELVGLVAGMALQATRDSDRASEFWQQYNAWTKRMRDNESRKAGARRIRTRPGGWL